MAKSFYYSITVIIYLFIISSCTPGSIPTEGDTVYQLNVTVDPSESGNVMPSSAEKTEGEEVEISASPNEGWIFERWQGDHTGTANPDTIVMNRNKDIQAIFIKKEYPLTIVYEGEGTVSEQVIQNKTTDYPYGTTVQLTATPAQGWSFSQWEGDVTDSENPTQVEITTETEITVVFVEEKEFSGGDGTTMNPYQVSNINELQRVAEHPDAHFVQINNIDASETASWNDGKGFKPIGPIGALFSGSYDGGEFEISGLTINRPNEKIVGLFGNAIGATIKNTGLVNATIVGSRLVGGLVGVIYEGGTIENSYVIGTIIGTLNIGGLTGLMTYTLVTDSYSMGDVSGDSSIGGLVGIKAFGGQIINSHSESNVSGILKLGGLVGINAYGGRIENSYAKGDVSGTGDQIGGLVGRGDYASDITKSHAMGNVTGNNRIGGLVGDDGGSTIRSCYATGSISGNSMVGGLAGVSVSGQIKNSYALGRVTGKNEVGGLVGVNDNGGYPDSHDAGQIFDSYAHGAVTGDINVGGLAGINRSHAAITTSYAKGLVSGNENAGGLVGLNESGIVYSYWDRDATGQSNGVGNGDPDGSAGLNTADMMGAFAETNMPEFDWVSIWMKTAEYPILRWQGEDENLISN